jgi:hypothetical protein
LAGKQAAQMWRNDEDIPNDLLPMSNKVGTVSPINGPAIYQAQGLRIISKKYSIDFK